MWHYFSENLSGNVHQAVGFINQYHPEWDVVALEFNGGGYTTVVHRVRTTVSAQEVSEQARRHKEAASRS